MLPSLLTLALSAFHTAAAHNTLTPRQNGLNAASVSTADFKSRFEQSGIVPEIIPALNPAVSFYAGYKSAGGRDALLVPGSTLTVSGMVPARSRVVDCAGYCCEWCLLTG